jgi:hypothetical protein
MKPVAGEKRKVKAGASMTIRCRRPLYAAALQFGRFKMDTVKAQKRKVTVVFGRLLAAPTMAMVRWSSPAPEAAGAAVHWGQCAASGGYPGGAAAAFARRDGGGWVAGGCPPEAALGDRLVLGGPNLRLSDLEGGVAER